MSQTPTYRDLQFTGHDLSLHLDVDVPDDADHASITALEDLDPNQ